jgi:hypothetical protein
VKGGGCWKRAGGGEVDFRLGISSSRDPDLVTEGWTCLLLPWAACSIVLAATTSGALIFMPVGACTAVAAAATAAAATLLPDCKENG